MPGLAETLRTRLPDLAASDDLERALAAAVARAAVAWPQFRLDEAIFVTYLGERCDDEDILAWLDRTAVDDLYLACACAHRDPLALATFERELGGELRSTVARLGLTAADIAETVAEVHAKLLAQGRIRDFAGRCALRSWLRVVATRAGISLARKLRPEAAPIELAHLVAQLGDPRAALIAAQLRDELRGAFAEAVAKLTIRERNLLRQHLLDDLTMDDLAAVYHVHRSSVARWVAEARERVWRSTVAALRGSLGVTPDELDSLLAAVRTGLDLSLERVLRDPCE